MAISPTAVEKDYWVSEVLRALVAEFPDDFIFKGGTSLSKGYGIVERFSEDIDVLVLPGGRGRGSVDKLMKAMGAAAARGVSSEAVSTEAETGRHRAYSVSYPATRRPTVLIATSALFEASVRGGSHPHEPVFIGSLLGAVLSDAGTDLGEFDDLAAFEVQVLTPPAPCWRSSSTSTNWHSGSAPATLFDHRPEAAGTSTTCTGSSALAESSTCCATVHRSWRSSPASMT